MVGKAVEQLRLDKVEAVLLEHLVADFGNVLKGELDIHDRSLHLEPVLKLLAGLSVTERSRQLGWYVVECLTHRYSFYQIRLTLKFGYCAKL